ncbi:MAG: hybrid sensor histidine kinase/response regulator [Syntrophorhabdaceae bacterium]
MDSKNKPYERLRSLLEKPGSADKVFVEETKKLLEDLILHQSELQAQNEELTATREVLEKQRHSFADLYDNAPVAYLGLNTESVIQQANRRASTLLGVPVQKIIGTSFQHYVHPEHTGKYSRYLSRVARGSKKTSCEVRLKKQGGSFFWGRLESVPVESMESEEVSVRSAVIDITERKEMVEALRQSEEKYRALVESMRGIVIRLDDQGRVTFLNKYGQEFFGYSPEELWAEGVVGTIVAAKDAIGFNVKDLLASIAAHPELFQERELENVRKNGEKVRISWTISTLQDQEGFFTGILALGNDVTQRRELEQQLIQSHKMEAIGTLAGGIAHDFNNMLAAILGFSEMAMEDASDRPEILRSIRHVVRASNRARDLVKQILTYSRKSEYTREPVSVIAVIKETVQFLRSSIPASIEVKLGISASSDTVLASFTEIQQILVNLATNASLAMEDNGGTLEIRLTDMDLEPGYSIAGMDLAGRDYIQLTVGDTGMGIRPEIAKRIFEPFFTTRDVSKGTGMGLSVVYGIVEGLHGMIGFESEPEVGTIFRVFLPKIDADIQDWRAETSEITGGDERILFIDDEDMLVEWAKVTLEKLGYHATALTDPAAALKTFSSDPSLFDLVITDQSMPSMSGMQLARKILAIRPDIPIIICTGHSATISPDMAKKAGINEFLMKPVPRRELAEAVRKALNKH